MGSIVSKPSTPAYRAEFDRIFGKKIEKKDSLKFFEFYSFCKYFHIGGTMFHCNLGMDEVDLKTGKISEIKCCEENCHLLDK